MIKVAEIKLQPYGKNGASMSVPVVWIRDNKLTHGKTIPIYRLTKNGTDVLILAPHELIQNISLEIEEQQQI